MRCTMAYGLHGKCIQACSLAQRTNLNRLSPPPLLVDLLPGREPRELSRIASSPSDMLLELVGTQLCDCHAPCQEACA